MGFKAVRWNASRFRRMVAFGLPIAYDRAADYCDIAGDSRSNPLIAEPWMSTAKSDISERLAVNFGLKFSGCGWFGFGWGNLAECAIAFPPYERRDNLCRIIDVIGCRAVVIFYGDLAI
ncbi:hypothetical protein [Methylomonas rhizoryzae]|uniref:hypothetical protein n=1 Tax=Methylomonas rhizoryzae TaxID=2608981 RepID=UPI0012319B84|nr:hypothetical protein [Methylomonas rhizoryzae]